MRGAWCVAAAHLWCTAGRGERHPFCVACGDGRPLGGPVRGNWLLLDGHCWSVPDSAGEYQPVKSLQSAFVPDGGMSGVGECACVCVCARVCVCVYTTQAVCTDYERRRVGELPCWQIARSVDGLALATRGMRHARSGKLTVRMIVSWRTYAKPSSSALVFLLDVCCGCAGFRCWLVDGARTIVAPSSSA